MLGLSRITRLLARLGDPHRHLPPVLHVAGTNGKGSTCAFLRAAIEASGQAVHVYTSPHLVRFNERIRIAGRLIDDAALAALLAEVLGQADGLDASFFEITTAAAFLAFARTPATACVIEVGLGGRLDATNVLPDPAATGIAALGIDHQSFLGDTAVQIAREKAGIAKPGRPLVTLAYPPEIAATVQAVADTAEAPVMSAGRDWRFKSQMLGLIYVDAHGPIDIRQPSLAGPHQHANLALAIAMLRHQDRVSITEGAIQTGARQARWPGRLQRLKPGPLTMLVPAGSEFLLDGGHNESAAAAILPVLEDRAEGGEVHVIVGMLLNKDLNGVLRHLARVATTLTGVPVPDHAHHAPEVIAQAAQALGVPMVSATRDIPSALASLPRSREPLVLIVGSLYLAGEVLRLNDELPD